MSVAQFVKAGAAAMLVSGCGGQPAMTKANTMTGQPYDVCIKTVLAPSFEIMDRMKAQGLDLSKPRAVTHLFVGPQENIEKATAIARKTGFKVLESGAGRLMIGEDVPIIEDWIKHTIPVNCSLASEYGLTYDGWDVDISKDGLKRK